MAFKARPKTALTFHAILELEYLTGQELSHWATSLALSLLKIGEAESPAFCLLTETPPYTTMSERLLECCTQLSSGWPSILLRCQPKCLLAVNKERWCLTQHNLCCIKCKTRLLCEAWRYKKPCLRHRMGEMMEDRKKALSYFSCFSCLRLGSANHMANLLGHEKLSFSLSPPPLPPSLSLPPHPPFLILLSLSLSLTPSLTSTSCYCCENYLIIYN